ncbi:MAG: PSD1 and planctomycete cytochrome C domain-containing protein [Aureliella sp.]
MRSTSLIVRLFLYSALPHLMVLANNCALAQSAGGAKPIDFARDVRPILAKHCFACHGPDAETRAAELRLDHAEGAQYVLEGAERSEVLRRISASDAQLVMPPPESKRPLSEEQIELLRRWIAEGGEYQGHWAFEPIGDSPPPIFTPDELDWGANPIDRFTRRKMEERGLSPKPPASAATLVRRISLDLTGLPPTLDEIQDFVSKERNVGRGQAVEELFDRLVASPRYGEHMSLAWLEASRYADTDGYQNDRYRYQHAWRDWVIRAFNDKKPFDEFATEQLAGDLLPKPTLWQQVATGFGRNHRINSEDGSIPEEWLVENVVDRVDTFGTVFLGLTIGCARCHDHKFDPIAQKDYYQLFAYFNSIAEHGVGPNNGNSPPFVELPESWPLVDQEENVAIKPEPVKLRRARETAGNGLRRPQAGSPKTVMVMHELTIPRKTYVLARGRYDQPILDEPVQPATPEVLDFSKSHQANDDRERGRSTRLDLAGWLFEPANPLTARVQVNRIWQHFWGTGLVATSDNFGLQGALPSHPALLDWLAGELQRSGWSVVHIQRLIVTSATYQQSSYASNADLKSDPKNRWLSRSRRQRLNAFEIRDQALMLAGLLQHRIGGPSAKPYMPKKIWSAISNNKYEQDSGANLFRRSLYTYWRRTIPPPTMMNFNAAAREVCSVQRESTNTPLQALTLLNNVTFTESARHFAATTWNHIPSEQRKVDWTIRVLFEKATARLPNDVEFESLVAAYKEILPEFNDESAKLLLASGESVASRFEGELSAPESASLIMIASMLLNLDETITRE